MRQLLQLLRLRPGLIAIRSSRTGLKSSRLRFKFGGKAQLLVIGSHPEVTLDQVRDRRDSTQEQIARGEDPRAADRASVSARTFKLAMSEGWCDINPAGEVTEGLAKARAGGSHPAIVDAAELRDLLAAVDALRAAPVVVLASRFLALTAVRLGSLRGARWDEIEDLDGAEPVWRVPAARMKLSAEKKLDPANDHVVPLSPAAVAVLRRVRAIADASPLIFPAGGGTAPIADRRARDRRPVPPRRLCRPARAPRLAGELLDDPE